ESLGHHAGDELLVAVGARLRKVLRPSDVLGRITGDVFGVLCEDVDGDKGASGIADRLIEAFGEPFRLEHGQVAATSGVGIAVMRGAASTPQELLGDAETAMGQAKTRGRGQVAVFDPVMRERATRRLEIGNALRQAIERNELRVHYQPKVSMRTR